VITPLPNLPPQGGKGHDSQSDLIEAIARYQHDPLGFARFAFPWGEAGSELDDEKGLRQWQAELLDIIGQKLREGAASAAQGGDGHQPIRIAVSSGHGIGKSALVSMVIHWAMATMPMTKVVVTAGTGVQLRTKTWPELAKWHQMSLCKHWFAFEATSIRAADPALKDVWRCDQVTWSENNNQAFAGLHNKKRRIVLIFDEASAIADSVWEVANGALTDEDTEIVWLAFGNPTEPTGAFRACFGADAAQWITREIDARQVEGTNKKEMQSWIDAYGEDSDFVRVRVKGQFPRTSSMQFIGNDVVAAARKREVSPHLHEPLICGVDVARFGDDQTVIALRKGRDCRSIPWIKLRQADTMAVAAKVAELHRHYRFDAIHVDGGGVGGGVIDRLRQLNIAVREVQFGGRADRNQLDIDPTRYANKRAEMWGTLRQALDGLAIPDDPELARDLTGVQYGLNARDEIQLERKEDMKKRDLASPDCGDALALTFAYPVFPSANAGGPQAPWRRNEAATEYDPFA
jgi:hypothetical protein